VQRDRVVAAENARERRRERERERMRERERADSPMWPCNYIQSLLSAWQGVRVGRRRAMLIGQPWRRARGNDRK